MPVRSADRHAAEPAPRSLSALQTATTRCVGLAGPLLRSLDAIHLATAEQLVASGKDISAFVTYDEPLAEAARACSFSVVAPGAEG
jgi:predicted nucleic acid-binding protein